MPVPYKKRLGSRDYQNYSTQELEKAVTAVKNGKMSQRKAALMYGIPRSTIQNWMKSNVKLKTGGQTVLSYETEQELVGIIQVTSDWGYPLESIEVRKLVQSYCNANKLNIRQFKENLPGINWFRNFLRRHKDLLSLKKAQNIKRSRAEISPISIHEYFDRLRDNLAGVTPNNILNYDETNISDDPGATKIVARKNGKHADRLMDTSRTSTSVMFSGTASGKLLPPYVVYKSLQLYDTWTNYGPEGAIYNRSKSGWFDTHLFDDYFFRVALPYFKKSLKEEQKVMIGDNCSSHLSYKVVKACIEYNIRFIFLPPNSTHLTQPLDVAYFRPFKGVWRSLLKEWKLKNRGVLPKCQFPSMLRQAIESLGNKSQKNLISGFRACGIYPFNPTEVSKRLPEGFEPPKVHMAEVLIKTLKQERFKTEKPTVPKRKALKLLPGQSVSVPEALEMIKIKEEVKNEPKSKKVKLN
uniref:CSON009423 protein n=1 Tax=Culicoides sonorensis TaxID=179676 RepID=A0A336M092_CULSO